MLDCARSVALIETSTMTKITSPVLNAIATALLVVLFPPAAQAESLLRDIYIAEVQLVTMHAKLKAIQERISQPSTIPAEVLIQMNPDFAALSAKREELLQRREELTQALSRPDDPRIVQIDTQIKQGDERIAKMISADGGGMQNVLNQLHLQEKMNEWTLKQDIRAQQILVQELKKRHDEQLAASVQRSERVINTSIDPALLLRLLEAVERMVSRLDALQSEPQPQRRAPIPTRRGGRFR